MKKLLYLLIACHMIAPLSAMHDDHMRALALAAHTVQRSILAGQPIDIDPMIKTLADNKLSAHHLLHVPFTNDDLRHQRLHDWTLTANNPSMPPTAYWHDPSSDGGYYNALALLAANGNMDELNDILNFFPTKKFLYKPVGSQSRFDVFEDAVIAHYKKATEKNEYISLYYTHKVISALANIQSKSGHDYDHELSVYRDAQDSLLHRRYNACRSIENGTALTIGGGMLSLLANAFLRDKPSAGAAVIAALWGLGGIATTLLLIPEDEMYGRPKSATWALANILISKPEKPSEPLTCGMSDAKKKLILTYAVRKALNGNSVSLSNVQDAIEATGLQHTAYEIKSYDNAKLYFDGSGKLVEIYSATENKF